MESTWGRSLELDLAADSRKRLHRAWLGSALVHAAVVALLALRPAPEPIALPSALTVDLIAHVPVPAPAPAPRPGAAKPESGPAPAPVEPAPPPPPPPQAKILPKRAPDPMVKPPAAREPIRRRPRPQEMELGDAMAALRSDLGESVAAPQAEATPVESSASDVGEASEGTVSVSPELMAWISATRRHVQSVWVNPPEFLNRGYVTEVRVELLADGTVVGRPEVKRSSGDPYADDNAVRALLKSSPLPPPPRAGTQIFIFRPEARP